MRRFLIIALAIATVFLVGNIFKLNRWTARYSVPIAAYTTIYPFPFYIESSYSEGYFQGVELGGQAVKVLATLAERGHCKLAVADGFVDVKDFQFSNHEDSELVMLCKSGGVAWNEILLIKGGIVKEIRISGGLWL